MAPVFENDLKIPRIEAFSPEIMKAFEEHASARKILARRKREVLELIQSWDPGLEKEIIAENL